MVTLHQIALRLRNLSKVLKAVGLSQYAEDLTVLANDVTSLIPSPLLQSEQEVAQEQGASALSPQDRAETWVLGENGYAQCVTADENMMQDPRPMWATWKTVNRDWGTCPICGEEDMRTESDAKGNIRIFCTNTCCESTHNYHRWTWH